MCECNFSLLNLDQLYICLVDILLPSGKKIDGTVSLIDDHHNIAIIHGDLDGIKGTSLSLEIAHLDVNVMSLGRNSTFGLMASRGKINIRRDVLESDDLMSSSCTISESGIGGPLVDISTGFVIGMNVYMQKKATLFMPSIILNHCFQQLVDYGQVMRPCLGLKTRSIDEKKLNEMELIYEKFPSTDGITVNEVIMGSLADEARISVGDIIILLNNIPVSSPLRLADLLLKLGKESRKRKRNRKHMIIKVVLQRPTASKLVKKKIELKYPISPYVNRWPLLPLDIPVVECSSYDFLSYKRGMT
ncbi:uncharacterized protein LOC141586105 [Silene latifolia]|uniref:uncharacterized protein LOC141586105 n=1 Tax=Silene latifolia TaxID=37657 RepID=UPI003D786945